MNIFKKLRIDPVEPDGILSVECLEQGWGTLQYRKDINGARGIPCGGKVYETGFGTHAPSRIRITLQKKAVRFRTVCGATTDEYMKTLPHVPDMVFSVEVNGNKIFTTGQEKFMEARTVHVELPENTRSFDLVVDGPNSNSHASWAETRIEFADGTVEDPSELPRELTFPCGCPVSFEYDGKTSAELFLENAPVWTSAPCESGEELTVTWTNGVLRMKTIVTLYRDFPVAEWHTEFENISQNRSGRLKNVRVLTACTGSRRQLLRRHGCFNDPVYGEGPMGLTESFKPVPASISENHWTFGGINGRPSVKWLPCFDLIGKGDDLRFVIGWAGQWTADIQAESTSLKVTAGMEELDSVLEPGEQISQPSVFMLYAEGTEPEAANLWRRFVLRHVMRDTPDKAPLSLMHWGGMGEESQMERIDDIEKHQTPYDVYWIDAGWFAPKSKNEFDMIWNENVGDWKFYPEAYPNKMIRIAERLHKTGHKLLLWFEPERVIKDRDIAKEHPEYLIFTQDINTLLDLGNPEAWKWCRNNVGRVIEENHIDWFREDFNFEPLQCFRSKDSPDRKGMTELRFVEGLYRFWKDLRESYPNLLIDNCSGGGCRLDVELMRYSMPLWYTDMQCFADFDPDYSLVQTEGLAHYLPVFGGGTQNHEGGDTYNFRANYKPALAVHHFYSALLPVRDDYPREWLKKMVGEYFSIRELFSGDFYVLAGASRLKDSGAWTIHQYARHDASRSVILTFRPPDSIVVKCDIVPKGISGDAQYRLHDTDGLVPERTVSGKELQEKGIPLELPERRSSAVIILEKI